MSDDEKTNRTEIKLKNETQNINVAKNMRNKLRIFLLFSPVLHKWPTKTFGIMNMGLILVIT